MKIHINAGHGGKDPGACGNDLQEKNITLKVALLLGEKLQKAGFEVSYTRITDEYISPSDIAARANKDKAGFFISLHVNSSTSISANGIETLAYSSSGTSAIIAGKIQNELFNATRLNDRGVKVRTDLVVLNSTKMDAVLVELGFISSKSDAYMLKQDSFLEKAAAAICKGISIYYKGESTVEDNKKTEIPQWQKEGLKGLVSAGVVGDEAYWTSRMSNTITVGEVLGLMGKMAATK